MKTLHTSVAFFHSFEWCARLLCNFAARRPHIVGQHHHVVYPDDVQRKLGGCVARCNGVNYLGVNYLGVNYLGVIHMHHGQASDMTGASWATGEVKMMQTHRQRLVDVQPYVAE